MRNTSDRFGTSKIASSIMRKVFLLILTSLYCDTFAQPKNDDYASRAEITGVWKSIGDGYLLAFSDKTITLYSYTSKYCYTEQNDYVVDLLSNSSKFCLNKTRDTLSVYLNDFGSKTKTLQDEKRFYKLKNLPDNCRPLTDIQRNDPEYLFELFYSTLKENYAFAKERNLDWKKIYNDYRPKITSKTTQHELFNWMGEIVTMTKDQHTKIISKENITKQYTGVPTALRLAEIFKEQDSIKNFNDFTAAFFKTNYKNISEELLHGKGKKVANGKIEWGEVTPDIGYIYLHSLTGFTSGTLPRRQHLDTLDFYMAQIMESLQNKKAIIVDVSFNFGGYDAAGLTISSYFTDKPVPVYTKYIFQNGVFLTGTDFIIHPSATYQFTKPVYLLTTDISRSAAESFAMQMKALPNVKLMGTNTLGILSDMLGKTIGEYYLTLSNEKYVTMKGDMYEVKGVDVDIPLTVFPRENMFNGHKDAVRQIIKIIGSRD
jgi:carboxyl-terminal processing protease